MAARGSTPVPVERIAQSIFVLRGLRILLDVDLARLYGVPTKAPNQAVKRNLERFPDDFVFRLSRQETDACERSLSVTGSQKHRDPRFPPCAFTEHGAIMAATVLSSARAVEMSLYVVRAFVKLREALTSSKQLAQQLTELERKLQTHDKAILSILTAMRELMIPPQPKRGIGFTAGLDRKGSQAWPSVCFPETRAPSLNDHTPPITSMLVEPALRRGEPGTGLPIFAKNA